jgi:hypothetical protein
VVLYTIYLSSTFKVIRVEFKVINVPVYPPRNTPDLLTRTALADRWTIAVYIPETRDPDDEPAAQVPCFGAGAERATDDNRRSEASARQQFSEADARQIIRAGFRQVRETVNISDCMFFWATPAMLQGTMMSHADALAVGIIAKAEAPITVSAINAELLNVVVRGCAVCALGGIVDKITEGKIIADCRKLIAQDATIEGSNALHAAAANQVVYMPDLHALLRNHYRHV